MSSQESGSVRLTRNVFKSLAKSYVSAKRPLVIAVGGSVGKTSTKLFVAKLLEQEKRVAYMDDSYNSGVGLYLSVFRLKIPTNLHNLFAWFGVLLRALSRFLQRGPEILILEYGIDHIDEMDEYVAFVRPDIAVLTAVSPEHMEFLHDIDTVAREELKLVENPRQYSVINGVDVAEKYTRRLQGKVYRFGANKADANYEITRWTTRGAVVTFSASGLTIKDVSVSFIAEPLIRQLSGAVLIAHLLGVSAESIRAGLEQLEPAASRMMLLEGVNESTVIDDTTNFSPLAGIEALKALKNIPAKRRIAVLGNMHELGDYADEGFTAVASHFKQDIDMLVLVGELSVEKFLPLATDFGFKIDKNLFTFNDAVSAGVFMRDTIAKKGDAILVKGPFGGYYLEETVKKLLKHPADASKLTRQSDFWIKKKVAHFGDAFWK